MPKPMLLDVDTGVDDAVAIALASCLREHELIALTTVAGNVPIEFTSDNTLRVAAWLGLSVPVYRGMSAPLARPLWTAREHHGEDGLGGWKPDIAPRLLEQSTAPEAIVRLARERQGEMTFVFLGPLTNLAVALNLEPRVAEWVDRLVIMGGAFFVDGNVTPFAEFNIYVDPEAAAFVAQSGMRATWVGLDATRQATLTREDWDNLAEARDPHATLVREVTRRSLVDLKCSVFHLHDPLTVAVAEDPSCVVTEQGSVVVDIGERRRGQTSLATERGTDIAGCVAREVDREAFGRLFELLAPRR